jgi:2-polyprenyl-3-methyl-5-hydroxy-6-metoxy-1,4-benzoquinol methylase
MSDNLTEGDRERIHAGIRNKYARVASSPQGQFRYPTGREGLERLQYDPGLVSALPDAVADSYCGVGNPLSLGEIRSGEHVLDVGCGAGVDALLAGVRVGETGSVLGIDLTPDMVERAKDNRQRMQAGNVQFQAARIQDVTAPEGGFDLVISNGVFNLVLDKEEALRTVFRLLRPGGRLWIADQFASAPLTKALRERVATWFQ